ncbi:MAG: sigma 54-interacting transcriptional regulator [Polyangiaceae bacterium]|nr:sigma 54-interacting transcriptional regulator [Polyangiaceae bacterium]
MKGSRRQLDVVLAPVMRSASMRRLDGVLKVVAAKDVAVTLIGESGTGKEVLARRIHELSPRRRGPFIPINCAAIPEALFESELFGHERGAFTGAVEQTKGKIAAAEEGTLFLDEVGEMPLSVQAKLLRFLENRRFMRVGGAAKIQADVRLVFATLRPLDQEVRAGRFRADLYYRIQGITIDVPPLRERRPDVAPLIAQFVAQLSARHQTAPPRLSRSAKAALLSYAWPGNVRELRNTVETLCLLRAGKQVRLRDLPAGVQRAAPDAAGGSEPPPGGRLAVDLDQPLERIIERVIDAVLASEGGNRSRAAERLGVSTRTIQRHLARRAGP